MKQIPIRYVVKSTKDHDRAKSIAAEALKAKGYRNVEITQTRDFDEQPAISCYATADHDLKRPPGILRTMRAVVLIEPERTEAPS